MKNWIPGLRNMKLRTAARELEAIKGSLEEEVLDQTQASSSLETLRNKLILIAEDNIANQKVVIAQLKELHFRADAVANGREALEALARIPNDLILMDSQTPERGGHEAPKEPAAEMDEVSGDNLPPPVDRERVDEALGEDPEALLSLYLSDMDRNFEKLATAIEAGRADEINSIAHNCAGVSATCGITAMVAPMRELERMGRENDLEGAAALGLQTRATFGRVKRFLEEEYDGVAVAM